MVLENGRSTPDTVVEVSGLSKSYPYHQKAPGVRGSLGSLFRRRTLQRHAVEGLTFRIARGEVVGFLGPNGAGKTTTLKLLCGLLYPSGGRATVLGHTPFRREHDFLRRIALVMGHKGLLWQDLPAMEMLLAHKEIYDLPEAAFRRSLTELSELLAVQDLLHVQVRKLSLGERMKLELLTALVHRPEVLFLDEPTIGLDVVSQQRVRDFLRRLNREQGTTILLTSHYMDDIQELCPRVLVIDHGSLRFDGPLAALAAGPLRISWYGPSSPSRGPPAGRRSLPAPFPGGTTATPSSCASASPARRWPKWRRGSWPPGRWPTSA